MVFPVVIAEVRRAARFGASEEGWSGFSEFLGAWTIRYVAACSSNTPLETCLENEAIDRTIPSRASGVYSRFERLIF
jgi:hypothetical protein